MTRSVLGFYFSCLFVPFCGQSAASDLDAKITPFIDAHKGKVAVAVKHLGTGESVTKDADTPMPTASLIKLPILVEAYRQSEEGKLKLSDMVTLTDEEKVPGSGILRPHFSAGATFPLRDAVRLMIVYSDNTATNMVLDKVGIKAVNARMDALGLPNTRVNAKVFKGSTTSVDPDRTKKYGLGSTTAKEMVDLLEQLHANKVASPAGCKAMIDTLKACDDDEKLTRFLPKGTVVAHKTGAVNRSKTDAGLIYMPDGSAVAVCVLTDENEDVRWVPDNAGQLAIAKIGKAVYDHFAPKHPKPKPSP